MALSVVFIILLFSWAFLAYSFWIKDAYMAMLASLLIMAWGLYVVLNGFDGVQDWLTDTVAMVNIGIAAYVLLRAGWEEYKEL